MVARRDVVAVDEGAKVVRAQHVSGDEQHHRGIPSLHGPHRVLEHVDRRRPAGATVGDPAQPEPEPHREVDRTVRLQGERGNAEPVDVVRPEARIVERSSRCIGQHLVRRQLVGGPPQVRRLARANDDSCWHAAHDACDYSHTLSGNVKPGTGGRVAAMATHDAVFVGSGINALAGAALLSRAGWDVCVLERETRLGGCIHTSDDLTLPGFTHEVLASWHPLWTGGAAYGELKDELDRRGLEYLNTDLADRNRVSRRLGCVRHDVSRGERGGDGAPRRRGRSRLGGVLQRIHGECRPRVRPPRDRALVVDGSRPRAHRVQTARPPRPAGVRRRDARQLPRLGDLDVRRRTGSRVAGTVGAAHGPRSRPGDVRFHDPGHRRRDPARRHAGAPRRWPGAGRRPRRDRA